jgi:2-amino-4-hydroxy-6-hydroxymethyldihydropteridine diphosphokinase
VRAVRASTRAYLGLGSNLGDRLANLDRAAALLQTLGIGLVSSSRVYETAPVGPPQPDYLNAVVAVATTLPPRELLKACLNVEERMGRMRTVRWGPRTVDVDILSYGRTVIDEPGLVVPHPRMHQRAFVLVPLLELDRDPVLPGGRSLGSMRLNLDPLGVRLFAAPLGGAGGRGYTRPRHR